MNFFGKKKAPTYLIISLISLLYTVFLLSPLISMELNKPPNTINLFDNQYYEDYYEYLSFIKQGQQGHLILQNLFTNDDPGKFFISWWIYSAMGMSSNLIPVRIPPWIVYWSFEAVFLFLYFLLTFAVVSKLLENKQTWIKFLAFLLTILASPFFTIRANNFLKFTTFDYWYSIGLPFSRYSVGTPHHLFSEAIFLFVLWKSVEIFQKSNLFNKIWVFFVFSILLLITSPPLLILYLIGVIISQLRNNHRLIEFIPLILICFITGFSALLFNKISFDSLTLKSSRDWELNHLYYPTFAVFVLTLGPVFFLAFLGLKSYLKTGKSLAIAVLAIFLFGTILTLFPIKIFNLNAVTLIGIHNLRFFNPAGYLFLGAGSALFLERNFRTNRSIILFAVILIVLDLIPLGSEWWAKIQTNSIYREIGQLQYMNKNLYAGLRLLENPAAEKAILTSPESDLGLAIPSLTGRKVFYGRSIFTLNFAAKRKIVEDFYMERMSKETALDFLNKEKIDTVVNVLLDPAKNDVSIYYNFLKPIFRNDQITILKLQ